MSDTTSDVGDTTTGHEAPITFYRLQACPYCERVARLLEAYELEYQSRFVEPLHSKRDVVKRVAGVRTVPVIVDEQTGVTMAESANIVDYLESTYGSGDSSSSETETGAAAGGDD
ncbi:glutaredoxin [Natrialba magadii ATCC 43099]|uniref:Glutaredoxin n=1 Tax=Natrialba magadii (strain ATCC 43099 / DSM 3394 / CCM 3739 / CIP 104546 / IAM 13178 / JCM 8861 / NBRC 102185 / NCIMB 2190 / MS3) TaxID=547559 RepID=D3SUN0_NATMM|nr:glutathione S-transferase N-terminal domain-containing protein [Natrialba magadii]ADD05288.1 glutaredoxin [Natrialba magadii ATCC 43099]ELY29163.1 glutaredoxin [Natrialba magadii ATCC 43099]